MDGTTSATAAMAEAADAAPPPPLRSQKAPAAARNTAETTAAPDGVRVISGGTDPNLETTGGLDSPAAFNDLRGTAMCVPYRVLFPGSSEDRAVVQGVVDRVFTLVRKTFSHFEPASEVSCFNAAGVGVVTPMSAAMAEVMRLAVRLHAATAGGFDPTAGALSAVWMRHLDEYETEPLGGGAELLEAEGYVGLVKHITFDFDANTMTKTAPTALDVCGLAKGWAVDAIATGLRQQHFHSFYVDWGGDLSVGGVHPSGRAWRCGIVEPPPLDRLFQRWSSFHRSGSNLDVGGAIDSTTPHITYATDIAPDHSVATSGDYHTLRKYGYHHIVCPESLRPLRASTRSLASATVHHRRCAVADAIATHLMVLQTRGKIAAWVKRWNADAESADDRVTQYYLHQRGEGGLAEGLEGAAPHTGGEGVREHLDTGAHRALRTLMRAVPQPVCVVAVSVAAPTGDGRRVCHAVTASSVVPLCLGGARARATFYFNVMNGSLLGTRLAVGAALTIHVLQAHEGAYAQHFAEARSLECEVSTEDSPVESTPDATPPVLPGAAEPTATPPATGGVCSTAVCDPRTGRTRIEPLEVAYPCRVAVLRTVGDHALVIAERVDAGPVAYAGRPLLLYGARRYWRASPGGPRCMPGAAVADVFAHKVVLTVEDCGAGARGGGATVPGAASGMPLGVVAYNIGSLSFKPALLGLTLPRSPLATAFLARAERAQRFRVHFITAHDGSVSTPADVGREEGTNTPTGDVAAWFENTSGGGQPGTQALFAAYLARDGGHSSSGVRFTHQSFGHCDIHFACRQDCHGSNPAGCVVNEQPRPRDARAHTVVYGAVVGAEMYMGAGGREEDQQPRPASRGLPLYYGGERARVTSIENDAVAYESVFDAWSASGDAGARAPPAPEAGGDDAGNACSGSSGSSNSPTASTTRSSCSTDEPDSEEEGAAVVNGGSGEGSAGAGARDAPPTPAENRGPSQSGGTQQPRRGCCLIA